MATARLKRRLEMDGRELDSRSVTQSFVTYGAPLPALTDKRDDGEFKPLHEQTVGRLHGAFTGGWSAGYFNTVGSKEGWTPSTFKSSRSQRATPAGAQDVSELAKSFMDDEDLADLKDAATLASSDAYGVQAASQPTARQRPTDTLSSLLQPSSSRIGLDLMRRMGWRDGQGVGPRVSHRDRVDMARELRLALEGDDDEDEGPSHLDASNDARSRHYFAPLNRPLFVLTPAQPSETRHGLAYKPARRPKLDRIAGTLETGGETFAYDSGRDLDDVDGGDASAHEYTAAPAQSHGEAARIPGFLQASQAPERVRSKTSVLPPAPPPDWRPDPSRLWQAPATGAPSSSIASALDADARARIMGESQPPASEALDDESRPQVADLGELSAAIDQATAAAALRGFKPYVDSPQRDQRYTLFLQHHAGASSGQGTATPLPARLSTQTAADHARELEDYARSARIFKPASTMLAGRFHSCGSSSDAQSQRRAAAGLYTREAQSAYTQPSMAANKVAAASQRELSPRQAAVRSDNFGSLTRSHHSFEPARLLCKRLRVAPPATTSAAQEQDSQDSNANQASTSRAPELLGATAMAALGSASAVSIQSKSQAPAHELNNDSARGTDGGENDFMPHKASHDIFAAVFGDADESETDDEADAPHSTSLAPTVATAKQEAAQDQASAALSLTSDTLATFRPAFQLVERPATHEPGTKRKKSKKTKTSTAPLSFDVDDGEAPHTEEAKPPKTVDQTARGESSTADLARMRAADFM